MVLPHTTVRCCRSAACQLQFADPQLDDEVLARAYATLYYPDAGARSALSPTPDEDLRELLHMLEARYGSIAGRRVLDYGCGAGPLLRIAKALGAEVVGVEQSANARALARQDGTQVYANITELRRAEPDARFDWILLSVVVEHLRQPWDELAELRRLLRPAGRLTLTTPNAESLKSRILGRSWDQRKNLTHFYYFTPTSLAAVLRRAGLEPTELPPIATHVKHGRLRRLLQGGLRAVHLQGGLLFIGAAPALAART